MLIIKKLLLTKERLSMNKIGIFVALFLFSSSAFADQWVSVNPTPVQTNTLPVIQYPNYWYQQPPNYIYPRYYVPPTLYPAPYVPNYIYPLYYQDIPVIQQRGLFCKRYSLTYHRYWYY